MLRGTRVLMGAEANTYVEQINMFRTAMRELGYEEIVLPILWEQQTFIDKVGPEVIGQMWAFKDKGERDVCLIPEATGLIQEMYRDQWRSVPKPIRLFYITRCYRYEKPQRGRYREFTQMGVELLGGRAPSDSEEVVEMLKRFLNTLGIQYEFKAAVKRGLTYYTEDGFEVECPLLGAQKQVAGGGRYAEGIGWAIGLERLILSMQGPQ